MSRLDRLRGTQALRDRLHNRSADLVVDHGTHSVGYTPLPFLEHFTHEVGHWYWLNDVVPPPPVPSLLSAKVSVALTYHRGKYDSEAYAWAFTKTCYRLLGVGALLPWRLVTSGADRQGVRPSMIRFHLDAGLSSAAEHFINHYYPEEKIHHEK